MQSQPKIQRYVSEELAHFVGRGKDMEEQYTLLVRILRSGWLTHPPHNPNISGNLQVNTAAKLSKNEMYLPQIVCFCDIPVDDLHIHTSKYSRFGLCLHKDFVTRKGGAPVFYLPRETRVLVLRDLNDDGFEFSPRAFQRDGRYQEISLGDRFDHMILEFHNLMNIFQDLIMSTKKVRGVPAEFNRLGRLLGFINFKIFSYIKFFDHKLHDNDPDNFYMEREWRVVGNVNFSVDDVQRIFIPKNYAKRLRQDIPEYFGQVTFVE